MRSTSLRVLAGAVALGALAAAAVTGHFAFIMLALAALLFLATSFSTAGGLKPSLERYRGRAVDVRVWGEPLPGAADGALTLVSVKALGAGLHLYLESRRTDSPSHLKIAQPGGVRVEPGRIVVESAAYVQWESRRLPRVAGAPAVTIALA